METLRAVVRNSSRTKLDYRYEVTISYMAKGSQYSITREVKTKRGIDSLYNFIANETGVDVDSLEVKVIDLKAKCECGKQLTQDTQKKYGNKCKSCWHETATLDNFKTKLV